MRLPAYHRSMSRKSANETLAVFLHQQDASTLVDILLELASESEVVRRRLERLSVARDGKRLAAAFRKTLNGWTRSRRYLDWDEARQFFKEQQDWLAQIERELLPVDPMRALELVEDYIASDAHWFERADDSAGLVGETVREACRLWLRCAARCETPADFWPERLATLYDHDEYGAREELLRRANLLLDEAHLRGLVARYEAQQDAILAAARARGEPDLPGGVFHPATAMVLLAEALQDPDVQVRATLRHSPQPNELQKEAFVRHYLEVGRPADALPWLDGPWQRHEDTRLRLRAQALQQLGRRDEAVLLRQQAFERTLTVSDFRNWMELLPPLQQSAAVEHARAVARACRGTRLARSGRRSRVVVGDRRWRGGTGDAGATGVAARWTFLRAPRAAGQEARGAPTLDRRYGRVPGAAARHPVARAVTGIPPCSALLGQAAGHRPTDPIARTAVLTRQVRGRSPARPWPQMEFLAAGRQLTAAVMAPGAHVADPHTAPAGAPSRTGSPRRGENLPKA